MNSTTESPRTSAHLSSVKELLAELDQMKNKGIGARERLDFILDQGAELVEEGFDFEDAFDIEARVRVKRIDQLDELAKTMTLAKGFWADAPTKNDVKEAAMGLFRHLDRFIIDAKNIEVRSHIETLSQIWESAPDLRWLYPWLGGDGPIYRPSYGGSSVAQHEGREYPTAPTPEEPSTDVKEFAERKKQLYKEATPKAELSTEEEQVGKLKKLWPEVPEKDWNELEHKTELEHNAELERLNKSVLESPSSEDTHLKASETKADWDKKIRDFDQGRSPVFKATILREEGGTIGEGEVVGTVGKMGKMEKVKAVEPEKEEDVVDHILHDAWTTALRDLTLDDWRFTKERTWTEEGSVLLWHLQTGEARLELSKLEDGRTNISLRILNNGEFWKHEEVLTPESIKELHLNPLPFVKKAIQS